MAVISFATPKGGAGKTTAAALLTSVLSQAGTTVCAIDADPNQFLRRWVEGAKPRGVTAIGVTNDDDLLDQIEAAAKEYKFVVIDLEGTMNIGVADAIAASSLVVIPLQASQLDAEEASKVLKLVEKQRRMTQRNIDAVLLWQLSPAAITTRTETYLREQFKAANVPMLQTRLVAREAYKAMFAFNTTIFELSPSQVSDPSKAQANAEQYAQEIILRLKGRG